RDWNRSPPSESLDPVQRHKPFHHSSFSNRLRRSLSLGARALLRRGSRPGSFQVRYRANRTDGLPRNAESGRSRRFAVSAFPARFATPLPLPPRSPFRERAVGVRGEPSRFLSTPETLPPKLSESPVTTPLGVTNPFPLGTPMRQLEPDLQRPIGRRF